MTARPQTHWSAWLTGCALVFATAHAWGEPSAVPAEKTSHGIGYVSGGIGLDESTALKAAKKDYSLDIEVFQSANGKNEYTAAVPLTVTRPNGEVVFEATTEGPFTLLRLPPSPYIVKVSHQGQVQQRHVQVVKSGTTKATFVFKPN